MKEQLTIDVEFGVRDLFDKIRSALDGALRWLPLGLLALVAVESCRGFSISVHLNRGPWPAVCSFPAGRK
jgi:hypothetical protein